MILVTGGAGFIGSHTCIELLNANYEIVVVDNFCNSSPKVPDIIKKITQKDFTFYKADISDEVTLDRIFFDNKITAVIHFAGLKSVSESLTVPLSYYFNNVDGTVILCKIMQKYNVKKIVFSSSATVYGMNNPSPLKEDFDLCTINPYGFTKLIIEHLLHDLFISDNQWSIAILRYFNPIGAHESGLIGEDPKGVPNNLMPYITQVAVGKIEKLNIFGSDYDTPDGTGVRDYIHVVDLAKGHLSALKKILETNFCETYNLGTGVGCSVLELVKWFEEASGVNIPYQFTSRRGGDISVCYADVSKAFRELGWKTERSLYDMCRDAWNWQKNNPNGFE